MLYVHFLMEPNIAWILVPMLILYKGFASVWSSSISTQCDKIMFGTSPVHTRILNDLANYIFAISVYVMFVNVLFSHRDILVLVLEGITLAVVYCAALIYMYDYSGKKESQSSSYNNLVLIGVIAISYVLLYGIVPR